MTKLHLLEEFELLEVVGEGTYGTVRRARHKSSGQFVALKKISMALKTVQNCGFPITAIREMRLLLRLNHPNVVRLEGVALDISDEGGGGCCAVYMVFEWMEHDLHGLLSHRLTNISPIDKEQPFTVPEVKCILKQLLEGLSHCHRQGILHRDLKSANLLLDKYGVMKLGDFGLGRALQANEPFPSKFSDKVITLWYRPPELLLGSTHYGSEVDVWSAGCILAELMTGDPIFGGANEMDVLKYVFEMCGDPVIAWGGFTSLPNWQLWHSERRHEFRPHGSMGNKFARFGDTAPGMMSLLKGMLHLDPCKRLTAQQALEHPFFTCDPLPCDHHNLKLSADSCHELRYRDQRRKRRMLKRE